MPKMLPRDIAAAEAVDEPDDIDAVEALMTDADKLGEAADTSDAHMPDPDDEDLARDDDHYPEEETFEGTTPSGHKQLYLVGDRGGKPIPICCQCHSCMMENRGGGMACDACQAKDLAEMSHDDVFI